MKKLIIFGTRNHSKIVTDMAEVCGYTVAGFISPTGEKEHIGRPVYASVEEIAHPEDFCFFIARGDNLLRKTIYETYPHLEYPNIIHPTSIISKYSKIGQGNLLMPYSVVNAFATIGDHCIVNTSAIVEHDCTVGNFCHVSVKSVMTGACSIGDGVFLGAGSTMRDGMSVGEWTTVGCGSAVVKNLEPNSVYVGCPAKLLRKNNK